MPNIIHVRSLPRCCKTCMHITDQTKDGTFVRCEKGLMIPTAKRRCRVRRPTVQARFIEFLAERKALKAYIHRAPRNGKVKQAVFYIINAFVWPPDEIPLWETLHIEWLKIIEVEYPQYYKPSPVRFYFV